MLLAERILGSLSAAERERAERVESILPALRVTAIEADRLGEFPATHVKLLSEAGLLGLVVPEAHGGLGGTLRDLAGATYAMGTACSSTALAFFFHCSSASRGLLGLEAIEAGLFHPDEVPVVRAFAERVLDGMGRDGKWLANFASESVKSSTANVTITTTATQVQGGWRLSGSKSFGCATGVADEYLVTAKLAATDTAEGLALFIVARDAEGVAERQRWDGIGMRASANHGIDLADVFVPSDAALTVPGAFVRMMQVSRGTFVGNQLAATAVYAGVAQAAYDEALSRTTRMTFADTDEPLNTSPMHQVLFGEMAEHLESCYLWLRRQLELETSEPPLLPKPDVVRQWRLAKGSIAEQAFAVTTLALKACGTSGAANGGVIARAMRDAAMGLVMAFPAERGKLDAAQMITQQRASEGFASR